MLLIYLLARESFRVQLDFLSFHLMREQLFLLIVIFNLVNSLISTISFSCSFPLSVHTINFIF